MPRWVKLALIVAVIAAVLAVATVMVLGGGHTPRHHAHLTLVHASSL